MSAEDSEAIRNLIAKSALTQDARDFEGHARCFTDDARYTHPKGQLEGSAAIAARSHGALSRLDASQHLLGSVHVVVSGTTGQATSYFHAQHVRADAVGGSLFVISGTYRDDLVLVDGEWRISHRHQEYTWREGNPDVIIRD
jgi:ketosteroid isomerase-like protein